MLWPADFERRLIQWRQLRDRVKDLDLESYLLTINDWWFQTPWQPYYLHWDDRRDWPDPWQLLDDNVFCDLVIS